MTTTMLISAERNAQLERHISRIPEHCRSGLLDYLRYGLPPGSFVRAVLENDLAEACSRADEHNQRALYDYVFVLYNYAPESAWGDPERVRAWIEAGIEARREGGPW